MIRAGKSELELMEGKKHLDLRIFKIPICYLVSNGSCGIYTTHQLKKQYGNRKKKYMATDRKDWSNSWSRVIGRLTS